MPELPEVETIRQDLDAAIVGCTIQSVDAPRQFLGSNDMRAYLVMTAIRLIELHRVLKPTGSVQSPTYLVPTCFSVSLTL